MGQLLDDDVGSELRREFMAGMTLPLDISSLEFTAPEVLHGRLDDVRSAALT